MTVLTPPTTSAAGGNGPWPDCGSDRFGACTLEPGRDGRGESEGAGAAPARVGLHLRLELQGRTDGGRHSAVVKVAVTVQLPWHSGSTGRQPAVGFSYDHI